MVKAVVFDLDGTLYDKTGLPRHLIAHELLHMRMLVRERKAVQRLRGVFCGDAEGFLAQLSVIVSPEHPEKARKWYLGHDLPVMIRALRRHYRVEEWVIPLLERLRRQGLLLAVYSDYGMVEERLRAVGLDPALFDCLAAAPELGGLKPAIEPARRMLEQLGVAPEEVLLVGDRQDTDGQTARSLGMDFEWVDRSQRPVHFKNPLLQYAD